MVSPKTSFLDWDQTASNNTDVGGIGIQGTNAVSNFDDALRTIMAQLRAGVDGEVVYAAKAANYTALANDNNAYLRFTSAATLSLTAVATLGANWHIFVQADGADVIVDPNASETINGATTITIRNGESAIIISTGSAFFARINPAQIVYAAKSGNYTALPADNGAIHRYTATATVTLTAAATLGSSWSYTVVADGAAVTIDPNASETINGALTLVIPNGSSARIICDGSNFFTVFKPNVWETINRYTLAAATTLPMTGLAAYQVLKATVYIVNSANATVGFRVSIDNGASYISTANHLSQTLIGSGASAAAATLPRRRLHKSALMRWQPAASPP
jgi:hypothetical protein